MMEIEKHGKPNAAMSINHHDYEGYNTPMTTVGQANKMDYSRSSKQDYMTQQPGLIVYDNEERRTTDNKPKSTNKIM